MLSAQVLRCCLGWELSLTDVAKVSGQVHSLSWEEGQRDELSLHPALPLSLEHGLEPPLWPGAILIHPASTDLSLISLLAQLQPQSHCPPLGPQGMGSELKSGH